jgi:hypothetical protein
LPDIQVTSLYFKPEIPRDKLANAIQEYAPNEGMSTVIVLVDETFWGSAKEGMIITNEKIILSKTLGGHVIPLTSINQIDFQEKHLIVNDLPVAKFSSPEILPLSALGEKLNEFIIATKKGPEELHNSSPLDDSTTEKLASFLASITEPLYYESTPVERRKPGATTNGYVLAATITEEQKQLIRFKSSLISNEDILCASWLGNHNRNDYFFCVTNCGVYSVTPGRPLVFISHLDLRNLNAVEECAESRYIGLRLSNGQTVIVSIQNAFVRPYAHELFAGVINILNGRESVVRVTDRDCSQQAADSVQPLSAQSFLPEQQDVPTNIHSDMEQQVFSQQSNTTIPFQNIDSDRLFEAIIKINTIHNVGDFVGSIFSGSDNTNSLIRKKFQSYVARVTTSFRNEIVENGRLLQFKNDVATMEICGAVMSIVFLQMQERGVNERLASNILFEGIRATFGLEASAQSHPRGVAMIKIIESYVLIEGKGLDDLLLNVVLRLIGSNLSGKLRPDYFEVIKDYAHLLENFCSSIEPCFDRFVKDMISESQLLIDAILNAKW